MHQPSRLSALGAPLVAGAIARACAAWGALSFVARDDYFHVLVPALTWLDDPHFDWDHSDTPGAQIRSHLLPRLVWGLLRGLQALGGMRPESLLRGLYAAMGLYSLLLIPALSSCAARYFDAAVARRAAWAAALFFPLPFAGTRLLIEALAMPPLAAALGLCASRQRHHVVGAGVLLGVACWWRPQCAAAVAGIVLWMGWQQRRSLLPLAAGLLLAVGAQGIFDWTCSGTPLGPLWNNVRVNLQPPATLSRSTVWGYAGFWLALSLPPATLWLLPAMLRAARQAPPVAAAWLTFVVTHALIAHKEDRFMLPVVPLWALLLAAAPAYRPTPSFWLRSWPAARLYATALAAVLLGLSVTSQSQANLRDAMRYLRDDTATRAIVSTGPELQTFFLARPAVPAVRTKLDEGLFHQALLQLAVTGQAANRFLAFAPDRQVIEVILRLEGYTCQTPALIEGWWFDRLLWRLNPRRNRRRAPVLVYACDNPAMATRAPGPERPGALIYSPDQSGPPHR